jgi:hypothetical protein
MGIAPIAGAQPYRGDSYDHDYRAREPRLVPLVSMDIHHKETVDIGRQAGRLRGLRLEAQRGAAYVSFVEVRYGDGQQQHFDIDRRVGAAETFDVSFGGERYVAAITVHGRPDRWSQIRVMGMR